MKTLNELSHDLDRIRSEYPPGSDPSPDETVCYVCLGGIEYQPIETIKVDRDDSGGAVIIFSIGLNMEEFERVNPKRDEDLQRLSDAFDRMTLAMERLVAGSPVRNLDEDISECETALKTVDGHGKLWRALERLVRMAKTMPGRLQLPASVAAATKGFRPKPRITEES